MNQYITYDTGPGIEAFSTFRDAILPYPVVQAHQTHGVEVAVIDRFMTREELEGKDALITDVKGLAIGVRTADCIPVLMYDPEHGVVAAVHSGWRGTMARIASHALEVLHERFNTSPCSLKVIIGPGIRMDSFQVGEDVAVAFREAGFPMDRIWEFRGPRKGEGSMDGGHHINLPEAVRIALLESGVPENSIFDCGVDTYTSPQFYSARREGVGCGRIINSIRLI